MPDQTIDDEMLTGIYQQCLNWGRWGEDDEKGTLNFITPAKRIAAAQQVKSGHSVSISRLLSTKEDNVNIAPMEFHMVQWPDEPFALFDYVGIQCHGFSFTHLDALAHVTYDGVSYNGRRLEDLSSHEGATFGSILAQQDGIFTRGVLLDIAAARGVPWLEPDDGVSVEDLERAEEYGGVRAESGDALFVRIGLGVHEAALGHPLDIPPRSGLLPETIPWLHEREISVYGGDCVEKAPSGTARMPLPLHQIGIVAMGLVLLDWCEVENLAAACQQEGRHEFLLTTAPLLIPGGTGSVVNPVATF